MEPLKDIIPGFDTVIYRKGQPQYRELPAIVCYDGTVITKWKFSFRERLKVLFYGEI